MRRIILNIEPFKEMEVGTLPVSIYRSNEEMGEAAAEEAAEIIKSAVAEKGSANIIIATGNSQLTFLQSLREKEGIDWQKVRIFHMDEYINLPSGHPASFPTFLQCQLLDHITKPAGPLSGSGTRGTNRSRLCRLCQFTSPISG